MLHQLYIIRSQVELAIAAAEADDVPPVTQNACEHPAEKRKPSNNMGEPPQFICFACGETVQGVA